MPPSAGGSTAPGPSGPVLSREGIMNTIRMSVRRAVVALALALGLGLGAGLGAPAFGTAAQAASPNLAVWPITLTTNLTNPWPTEYATLAATSSVDIGAKQLVIDIYDQSSGNRMAQCNTGYSCYIGVMQYAEERQTYIAYLTDGTD